MTRTLEQTAGAVEFHRLSTDETILRLNTDSQRGLSGAEASIRLQINGLNKLREQKPAPAWRRFLRQLEDTLVILLIIAAIIAIVVWYVKRDGVLPYDAIVILAIVGLNGLLGFAQEERAEKALAALKKMSAPEAKVIRDSEEPRVLAEELVPGDLLLIEEGDSIPADARLIEAVELKTVEASLTGESVPVAKSPGPVANGVALGDRRNMLFTGTTVAYGHGRALVTATGMNSELGRIAGLLERAKSEPTPLQRELDHTGKRLGAGVAALALVIVATLLISQRSVDPAAIADTLMFGVALAVAAVPEGLAAIVTVVLSLGVQRMARRGAIVRKLPSVETLGSVTVVASDKTGTLTRNEMTARVIVTNSGRVEISGTGYVPQGVFSSNGTAVRDVHWTEVECVLRGAVLNNNSTLLDGQNGVSITGDPMEAALLVMGRKAGFDRISLEKRYPRVREIPFSSDRKMMTTIHAAGEEAGLYSLWAKGAPEVLLRRCEFEARGRGETRPLTDARRAELQDLTDQLAKNAMRTLAVAYRAIPNELHWEACEASQLERDLILVGLIGILDPPRPEAAEAVKLARSAGIRPIMITGDHPETAAAVARELGIASSGRVITGAELEDMERSELLAAAAAVSVYARVNPTHKLRIVDALQANGAIVAMTGDGVNDAPALKAADIGIAMGITGTDVSKEAADVVLTDDNFATIVAAIEEGRAIFANIQKFLRYLLSANFGEVLSIFLGVVFARQLGFQNGEDPILPLLATQILWVNLITDGPPALALGMDLSQDRLMESPPRPRDAHVITKNMWITVGIDGVAMAIGTLLIFDASLPGGLIEGTGGVRHARTMAFTTFVLFELFHAFNCRSHHRSAFADLQQSHYLIYATILSIVLQVLAVTVPFLQRAFETTSLSLWDWAVCVGAGSSVLWVMEFYKRVLRRAPWGSVRPT